MQEKPLILALPKGRILEELVPLLTKIDIAPEPAFFDDKARQLYFNTNHPGLDIIRVRSFDVATFVAFGAAQMGVVGRDVIKEFNYPDIYALMDLPLGYCRLSVAEPTELLASDDPKSWNHIRVATKYPAITKAFFKAKGIQAECIKLNGAMELAPKMGLCERIVDLVSSGKTLKDNGLSEVETIMEINAKWVVHRPSYKTRLAEMKPFIDRLKEVI